jgi:hypothetical protein
MQQENLLPDTHAIMSGTIEETSYRGKWLVRWKDLNGGTIQRKFATVDESHDFFLQCVDMLRADLRAQRNRGEG